MGLVGLWAVKKSMDGLVNASSGGGGGSLGGDIKGLYHDIKRNREIHAEERKEVESKTPEGRKKRRLESKNPREVEGIFSEELNDLINNKPQEGSNSKIVRIYQSHALMLIREAQSYLRKIIKIGHSEVAENICRNISRTINMDKNLAMFSSDVQDLSGEIQELSSKYDSESGNQSIEKLKSLGKNPEEKHEGKILVHNCIISIEHLVSLGKFKEAIQLQKELDIYGKEFDESSIEANKPYYVKRAIKKIFELIKDARVVNIDGKPTACRVMNINDETLLSKDFFRVFGVGHLSSASTSGLMIRKNPDNESEYFLVKGY